MPLSKRTTFRLALWSAVLIFCGVTAALNFQNYMSSPMHNPKTATDFYSLSKKLDREGDFVKARAAASTAVELDNTFGKAYLMLAALELEMGDYHPAVGHLERALELVEGRDLKNEYITYFNLGITYENLKDPDRAWKNFRKSYAMEKYREKNMWPDNPKKNAYYVMTNDREEYERRILDKDRSPPRGIHWRVDRFDEYKEKKQYRKIVDDCQDYIDTNPGSPYLYKFIEYKAYGFSYLKRYDEALALLAQLDESKLSDDNRGWVKEMYGYIYREKKEYDLALDYYDAVYREHYKSIDQEETLYAIARVYREKGDSDAEIGILKQILREHPDTWHAYHARSRLADIYLYKGKYKKSFRYFFDGKAIKYVLGALLGGLAGAGMCLLVFFIIYRVFFAKKRDEIRASPYRLWHLFVVMAVGLVLHPLLWTGMMAYNKYVFDIFSRLQVNPNLLAMVTGGLVSIIIAYMLLKRYGLPKELWRFSINGPDEVKLNIGLPILLTLGLFAFSILYEILLKYCGVVDPPPTYVEEIVRNVFVHENAMQIFLLLIVLNVVGPVSEEIIFRAFAIEFTRKYTNIVVAVILSGLAFTVGHSPVEALPFYFVFAMTMSLTYIKTKRIFPCIATHCLFNTGVTLIYFMFG